MTAGAGFSFSAGGLCPSVALAGGIGGTGGGGGAKGGSGGGGGGICCISTGGGGGGGGLVPFFLVCASNGPANIPTISTRIILFIN